MPAFQRPSAFLGSFIPLHVRPSACVEDRGQQEMVPSFHHEGPRDRTQSSSWAAKQEVAGQPAVPSSKVSNPNSIHNLNSYLLYDLKYIQVWGS